MAFKKAEKVKHGGKFLFYGKPASGKSYAGLTFNKIAVLDSETGLADYVGKDITIGGKKYNNLVNIDQTSDLEDLEDDLDALLDGEFDDEIETIIIDSETKFYAAMQLSCLAVAEKQAKKKGAEIDDTAITMRGWGRIKNLNQKYQQAKIALSSKGIHVVSVAQGVDITDDNGKAIGIKPDMAKNIQFDYDVIVRFFTKETKNKDGSKTIEYFGEIMKDRTNVTNVGDIIQNVTYDIWKDYYESGMKGMSAENAYRNDLKNSEEFVVEEKKKSEREEEKVVSELVGQIISYLSENKSDINKVKLIMAETKVRGYTNPKEINNVEDAKCILDLCK